MSLYQRVCIIFVLLFSVSSNASGFECPLSSSEPKDSPLYISPEYENENYPIVVTEYGFDEEETGIKNEDADVLRGVINCSLRHMFYFSKQYIPEVSEPFDLEIPAVLTHDGLPKYYAPDNGKSLMDYADEIVWFYDRSAYLSKFIPFSGFSAEDDHLFHNKDRLDSTFFQLNKQGQPDNGTIRVALLPKAVQAFHLAYTEGVKQYYEDRENNAVKIKGAFLRAIQHYAPTVGFHEYMHAAQYHLRPLHDLNYNYNKSGKACFPELEEITGIACNCPYGMCNEYLMREQRIKIYYEEIANKFSENVMSLHPDQIYEGGVWLADFEEKNPTLFKKGGKFFMLNKEGHFDRSYLRGFVKSVGTMFDDNGRFVKNASNVRFLIYAIQVRPTRLVHDLYNLNNDLFRGYKSSEAALDDLCEIEKEWSYFAPKGDLILQPFPFEFLSFVNDRYKVETQRAKEYLGLANVESACN